MAAVRAAYPRRTNDKRERDRCRSRMDLQLCLLSLHRTNQAAEKCGHFDWRPGSEKLSLTAEKFPFKFLFLIPCISHFFPDFGFAARQSDGPRGGGANFGHGSVGGQHCHFCFSPRHAQRSCEVT